MRDRVDALPPDSRVGPGLVHEEVADHAVLWDHPCHARVQREAQEDLPCLRAEIGEVRRPWLHSARICGDRVVALEKHGAGTPSGGARAEYPRVVQRAHDAHTRGEAVGTPGRSRRQQVRESMARPTVVAHQQQPVGFPEQLAEHMVFEGSNHAYERPHALRRRDATEVHRPVLRAARLFGVGPHDVPHHGVQGAPVAEVLLAHLLAHLAHVVHRVRLVAGARHVRA
mmetsp:Transcript_20700/g.54289  ORF Transcript_20700/g.54289 Transcript_20700/m.54289 type:complete len:227 (+) Transcript_20700:503-1183(+)